MNNSERYAAAARFVEDWSARGDEKQDTQSFWIALLQNVYGVEEATKYIQFELPVKLDHTSFIDGYIPAARVLIEQKGKDIDLRKGYKQSDGSMLTPFGQARRYAAYLPHNENPRWIVICNFREFHIHDMNRPNDGPEILKLSDLPNEYHRLNFLIDTGDEHIKREMEISLQAGELVGLLYDALLRQYKDPAGPDTLRSLNMLCVRLVFCLYAEDAGIFGGKNMFHDYLRDIPVSGMRRALAELFRVLDQSPEDRDKYLADDVPALAAFPYVNGGLFSDENIEIPPFTEELKAVLLGRASEGFDWSQISPTIFGAVFESTLNPETRRSGGMHYTSIENIHKVIDPLFLDGLKSELDSILSRPRSDGWRSRYLREYQSKLAGLRFLDPACGSGNFLTETYLSLRELENRVIKEFYSGVEGQTSLSMVDSEFIGIQVSIGQFYGIEINDFAVSVAKTALWIAESQMLRETENIVQAHLDFLPLKSYANIEEENALRVDWESIAREDKLSYIIGNPPFVGYSLQSKKQKEELLSVYVDENGKPYRTAGKIDYVAGWYFKAAEMMQGTKIRAAFVSTNSITQGEQAAAVWKPLFERFGIHIDFAHRTFRWDSEASLKAHVHCVIVGFSVAPSTKAKRIYSGETVQKAGNINAYLLDAPNVLIDSRAVSICDVPTMVYGNKPTDGGFLFLSSEERDEVLRREPEIEKFIRQVYGASEYINNKPRYCLWLVGASPAELRQSSFIMDRVEKVKQFRLNSPKTATKKSAETPTLFQEIRQPDSEYIIVPRHSSENRRYIPFGFVSPGIIVNDAVQIIPNAQLYHFGILTSNIHMAWMRAVCGRLEMRYRYSKDVVYNNFPWPTPTEQQKEKIAACARAIIDARRIYDDSSLADLYDERTMPPELRRAHQQNDKAVWEAYGRAWDIRSEPECVAHLMKLYQELIQK